MSRDLAIEVKGLGKRFEIGASQGGYQLLTENIAERVRSLGRRPPTREFWALRDVGFEVKRGETFGIVGHNGAGKSTLLKILSRVTPPTEGRARLVGRVGALLEVGTGFHPELTGRENIFLNGAILTMKRREILAKFDEIVEFADIGPFLDTPVKRYSSGMQMRLAFSVAAHLEPEILIIDEVLSVGDAAFQEKCLGRMETVAGEGRTVVFISHNLGSVRALCNRAIMLSGGRIVARGRASEVVDTYLSDVLTEAQSSLAERENRVGDGRLRYTDLRLERGGEVIDSPTTGRDFDIVVGFETEDGRRLENVNFGVTVTAHGEEKPLMNLYSETAGSRFAEVPGRGEIRCHIESCPLPAGQYFIGCWSDVHQQMLDAVSRASDLTVAGGDYYESGREQIGPRTVLVDHSWSLSPGAAGDGREAGTGDRPVMESTETLERVPGRSGSDS
jgi:lipopolysaccharide transport system ATP-binding protein